jgi:PAS domain S-box-containing protein
MARRPGTSPLAPIPATISMLAARPPRRSVFSSLRFRLILAVAIPFLAAASLIVYETLHRRAYAVRHSHEQVTEILNEAAGQEQRGLEHAHQLLAALAHVSCVRNVEPAECNKLFAEIVALNPRFAAIILVSSSGEPLAGSLPPPSNFNARGRAWYERVIKTRRLSIGTYAVGLATGRPSIHLAQPMMRPESEEMTAILVAAISLDHLAGLLPTNLPEGSSAYILDSEGTILARAGAATELPGTPFQRPPSGAVAPDGSLLVGDLDIRLGESDHHPLRVALTVPKASVLQNSDAMVKRAIASLAILAILSLAVWALGDRFLIRRTQALVRVTRDLGAGRFDVRAPVPYDRGELGELERAFNAMADSLQRREAAVVESEGRFREITETIQEVFWILSPDRRSLLYLSPAFEPIWGRPVSSMEGSLERLLATVDPEDAARIREAFAKMGPEGFREEFRIRRPDDGLRWISTRAFPVRDSEGRVSRIIGSSEDITERRGVEEQFRQSQKMEALGRLAGGVAHDFNNLLTVISGYAELLMSDPKMDDETRHQLQEIAASSKRASSLTRQLLAFSRKQIVQRQPVDLNDTLRRMQDMLRRLIGENVKLTIGPGENLATVMADPGHIEQTIMNLVVNARDALPRGGSIRIETANVELDEAYAKDHSGVVPGEFVMLAVSDTGIGMDAATRARLFEPFFTTKERGKGTGLGLATVYGIAKQFGGHIWVYSEPGRGSCFKIYFPKAASGESAPAPRAAPASAKGGTETILVVEDDPNLRRLVRDALQTQGYTVLEAADGDAGLKISDGHEFPIHLLLTDSVLPGISGPALSKTLKERRPGLKVLFMSGYTDASVFEQAGVEIGRDFLQKPFTVEALARKIREILDPVTA